MANCNYVPWSLKELATAISTEHCDKKEIVVPMFQRGKRWSVQQEKDFVDSLERGYPVGTMLFYRSVDGDREIYTLIDGLQRANTIKNYLLKPTNYVEEENIPQDIIDGITNILSLAGHQDGIKKQIKELIIKEIQESPSMQKIQCHIIAHAITTSIPTNSNDADYRISNLLYKFISDITDRFNEIASRVIPVIVYSGEESTLPYIFDRINSKGTPLTQYEVFAASWPQQRTIHCETPEITEYVIKKYEALSSDGYTVKGYSKEKLRSSGQLNIFEFVFGFSRYINEKFTALHISSRQTDDEIDPLGFELINACLNSSKEDVRKLYKNLIDIDVNLLSERIVESIKFVEASISPVSRLKGNKRNANYILHSKYQIISMIAYVFRERYESDDLVKVKKSWKEVKDISSRYLLQHYIHDIITSEWNEGGTTRIFTVLSSKKYSKSVSGLEFTNALNAYFAKQSQRQETKNVATPSKEDIVVLNTIYTEVFSASDQLSRDTFDIEHLAPKEQVKQLIDKCGNRGLPISSIANLCYLPQKYNRSKGKKTIYQDKSHSPIEIADIESKYSFTSETDFEWLDAKYRADDYEVLKAYYHDFLISRFCKQKKRFFSTLGIEYLESYDNIAVTID